MQCNRNEGKRNEDCHKIATKRLRCNFTVATVKTIQQSR